MKKIIAFIVMSCLIAGCSGLKPDETVKNPPYQDNTQYNTAGSQPEGQGTVQNPANPQI